MYICIYIYIYIYIYICIYNEITTYVTAYVLREIDVIMHIHLYLKSLYNIDKCGLSWPIVRRM